MDLNLNELANQDSFLQKSIQLSANRWKIFLYLLSSLEIVLCIVVMSLDINLSIHDLSELTKYLGFTQSIVGIILIVILLISIKYSLKTLILFYIICADILSVACGIMFILLQISADIQYYNGEAPLQPAHTKIWFKIFRAYFILSLTLTFFTLFKSFFACKLRSIICELEKHPSKLMKTNNYYSNMNKESLFKRSEQTSLFPEEDIHKNDQHNPSINININNNKIDPKLNKQYNKENNSFISRKRIENLDENNSKQDKTEINIYESQEKSFHNSPQSSKKIKLPISQVPVSILEDRREENWGESGRGINTRTMNSEINKQDIENFLLDTPSEVTLTLNLQKNSYK